MRCVLFTITKDPLYYVKSLDVMQLKVRLARPAGKLCNSCAASIHTAVSIEYQMINRFRWIRKPD